MTPHEKADHHCPYRFQWLFDVYEIIPGMFFATVAVVVVSQMTPAPARSIQSKFEEVEAIVKEEVPEVAESRA